MTFLRADHISMNFGRNIVLRNASFEVCPGEIVGISGENGSGKSTLLNIITGNLRQRKGKIDLFCRWGHCPQDLVLFEDLTVREHFEFFRAAYSLSADDFRRERDRLVSFFDFSAWFDTVVQRLSGGTRQKLSLSLALLHKPELMILDEPYSNFDWQTYRKFWEFARAETSAGRSILIVSHFFDESGMPDRALTLKDGIVEGN